MSPPPERSRNLVFTSAGDRANVGSWLNGPREWDLWLVYYGDSDEHDQRYRELADHYERRRGAKFPNLLAAVRERPELWERYDAVLVLDDDIRIGARAINRLFRLRARHDLWVLQPAFHPRGKISVPITRRRRTSVLRLTDFVEVTCPLFRRDKLDAFLRVYDPALVGYGVCLWYSHFLRLGPERKGAIVDAVPCVNPHDAWKGPGGREIDRLEPLAARRAMWEVMRARHGIPVDPDGPRELGALRTPAQRLAHAAAHPWLVKQARKARRRLRRRGARPRSAAPAERET